jgi:hypothetical protein
MSSTTLQELNISIPDTSTEFLMPDYFTLDATGVQERIAFLIEIWNSFAPELDLRYGVYNSTVVAPAATFSQGIINSIDSWRENTQIAALLEKLQTGVDEEQTNQFFDLFLLNYRIHRNTGQSAHGLVTLLFDRDNQFSVGPSNVLTAKQLTFVPVAPFTILPTTRTVFTSNEQRLVKRSDGLYSAVIEVVCESETTSGNLAAGTQLFLTQSIQGFIGAYAQTTFLDGSSDSSVEELYHNVVYGVSAPIMSSRTNMSSLLRSQVDLLPIHSDSIIGLNDMEMTRDQHSVYPISCGGRADWYVRTSQNIITQSFIKRASRVSALSNNSAQWRIHIERDDLPGFYSITKIEAPELADPLEQVYEHKSYDLTNYKNAPDIVTPEEAAFSRFQTMIVDFIDPSMDRFGTVDQWPTEYDYTIYVDSMPRLAEIQEYVSTKSNVSIFGDILVKAPIPCKVKVSLSVCAQPTQTIPDGSAIQSVVVNTIHSTGFTNSLAASVLIRAIQDLLPDDAYIEDFTMTGSLLLPDGKTVTKSDTETLTFYEPPYATAKTISFFCDLDSVVVIEKTVMTSARFL